MSDCPCVHDDPQSGHFLTQTGSLRVGLHAKFLYLKQDWTFHVASSLLIKKNVFYTWRRSVKSSLKGKRERQGMTKVGPKTLDDRPLLFNHHAVYKGNSVPFNKIYLKFTTFSFIYLLSFPYEFK